MATPVKVVGTAQLTESTDFELVCFICHVENTVNYKIGGRKAEKEGFVEKLSVIVNNDRLIAQIQEIPTTVCRNCYAKTVSTYNFLKNVRNCASKHVEEGDLRVKRCASSPLTPKLSATNSSDDKRPAHRSRTQLKLGPDLQEDQDAPVDKDPTYVDEHGYSRTAEETQERPSKKTLQKLSAVFEEMKSEKLLCDLRSLSRSLTSRTMFGSVLFKNRDTNKLVDNADHFLEEIVEEMITRCVIM
jgi:hypothetical protein